MILNGTGQITGFLRIGKSETRADLETLLNALKARCTRLGVAFPRYFFVDNAEAYEGIIKSVMGENVVVLQDIKHLINRILETVSKKNLRNWNVYPIEYDKFFSLKY